MADWETVTILRKKPPKASAMKSEQAINAARRQGVAVDTQQKCARMMHIIRVLQPRRLKLIADDDDWEKDELLEQEIGGAATNKQHVTTKNTAKLDRETEELKHEKVSLDLGKLIQQGRQAKGWSQKELATKVNEKPQVINDYEAGRGIPNQVVIGKIERAIGIKLRGKDRGRPTVPPGTKKD